MALFFINTWHNLRIINCWYLICFVAFLLYTRIKIAASFMFGQYEQCKHSVREVWRICGFSGSTSSSTSTVSFTDIKIYLTIIFELTKSKFIYLVNFIPFTPFIQFITPAIPRLHPTYTPVIPFIFHLYWGSLYLTDFSKLSFR